MLLHALPSPGMPLTGHDVIITNSPPNLCPADFHAPGNPDEPLGSVTMLHSTQVENQKKATQACFTEPNSVRQTKNDGTGVLKDVRFVLK